MFDSADFLTFARACLMQTPREAAERSAISRSYYAAYHSAHAHAQDRGVRFSGTGDDHGRVVTALRSFDHHLGDNLHTLRTMRRLADYDLAYTADHISDDVQIALDMAHDIVRRLSRSGR